MAKKTKTYDIEGTIKLTVTSDSDKDIKKAIAEFNKSLPESDLISTNGAIQKGKLQVSTVKERNGKKFSLTVAWGTEATNIYDDKGFDYLKRNAGKLGIYMRTYGFNTEAERNAFELAVQESSGWENHVYKRN